MWKCHCVWSLVRWRGNQISDLVAIMKKKSPTDYTGTQYSSIFSWDYLSLNIFTMSIRTKFFVRDHPCHRNISPYRAGEITSIKHRDYHALVIHYSKKRSRTEILHVLSYCRVMKIFFHISKIDSWRRDKI